MAKTPTPNEVVTSLWSAADPIDAGSVESAARAVADLVRYLNHATVPWRDTLRHGPDLYAVLTLMTEATQRLPQLLDQMSTAAEQLAAADTSPASGNHAVYVATLLTDAARIAEATADRIGSATQHASHLERRDA